MDLIAEVVGELADRDLAVRELLLRARAPQRSRRWGCRCRGWLSRDRLEVRTAANLGLAATPLAGLAEARLNCPVLVENDGNAAAFAEYVRGPAAGRGPDADHARDRGGWRDRRVGGLAGGSHGLAGEIGHLTVGPGRPRPAAAGAAAAWSSTPAARAWPPRPGPGPASPKGHDPVAGRSRPSRSPPGRSLRPPAAGTPGRPGCSPARCAVARAVACVMPVLDPDLVVLTAAWRCRPGI